nr:hypothetical protein [Tanacetum cinerariifolium]
MRSLVGKPFPTTFEVSKASMAEFPALNGSLEVGFVDTTNKLFTQTLQEGDIFVFPKALVHFQFNNDAKNPVVALSAFGSANAGTVSVPNYVLIQPLITLSWLCRSKLMLPPFRRLKLVSLAKCRPK